MITVAVCDDNIPVLEKLAAMLKELCGHYFSETEIKTYTGGTALLEAHEETPFDVLFLDIRMPEVDGFSVADRVRRMGKKSFIIFFMPGFIFLTLSSTYPVARLSSMP